MRIRNQGYLNPGIGRRPPAPPARPPRDMIEQILQEVGYPGGRVRGNFNGNIESMMDRYINNLEGKRYNIKMQPDPKNIPLDLIMSQYTHDLDELILTDSLTKSQIISKI